MESGAASGHQGPLGPRFKEALAWTIELHDTQPRKGSETPYAAHLLSVAALVLEGGGDEDQAIAGLLHDAAEDQGGQPTLDEIRRRFGDRVTRIVRGCTDSLGDAQQRKPMWRPRKQAHLRELEGADADLRLVYSADKIHNIRDTLTGLHRDLAHGGDGSKVWGLFGKPVEDTLWYYRTVTEVFRRAGGSPLQDELERQLAALHVAAGVQPA
ncbi:MAG: HD domain-containing protein [Candidatus Eisenbacteria bacterium]